MKIETLEQAKRIVNKLTDCKNNLEKIEYTQVEDVAVRKSYLQFTGIKESIEIPESLFRAVGKMIQSEYILKIKELEKKLEQL